jgi:tRNA A-37 threonylcarbamoyl transferase component Bud32
MTDAPPEAPTSKPRIGCVIDGRYRLLDVIGRGGMGAVFRAEHMLMHKEVAIKILHPELGRIDGVARRFEREARSVSRLSHEHIIRVTDFGRTADGELFLVMELLRGEPLGAVLARGGRLPVERAVGVMRQVLDALDHAHRLGVVHRDLKPDNIMLARRDDLHERDHVKLLDFGIAKINEDAAASDGAPPLTQAGVTFGTPHYMAPEQATAEATDARADLYACGVILYEMLTGRRPFEAASVVQVLSMHLTMPPTSPRKLVPEAHLPEALDAVVLRALAKRREDRYQSASQFRQVLDTLDRMTPMAAATPAPAPTTVTAGRRAITLTIDLDAIRARTSGWWTRIPTQRRPWVVGGVGATLLVLVLFAAWPSPPLATPKRVAPAMLELLRPANEALERGDLPTARAMIEQLLATHSDAAPVHYVLANVSFAERDYAAALREYREAVRIDAGYGGDGVLLRNVRDLVGNKRFTDDAMALLTRDVGKPAGTMLADIASTDKRYEIRRAARNACVPLACARKIDLAQSYILDLGQAKSCEERRDAVIQLGQLGDARALEPLRKLKRRGGGVFGGLFGGGNECLRADLDDAIARLEPH